MITQIVLLATAIFVLMLGLAFVCIRGAQLEHRIEVLERKLNTLNEAIEIRGNHIDHIYNILISMTGELKSLKKAIQATDAVVSEMDGELLKMNDLKKQLDCLTTEIINQKHEEN